MASIIEVRLPPQLPAHRCVAGVYREQTIVCVDRLPLLVHCLNGGEVTGTVMMCLRKLQNWNLSSMLSEYSRYVGVRVCA